MNISKEYNKAGKLFLLVSNSVTKELSKKYYGVLYLKFVDSNSVEFLIGSNNNVYRRVIAYSDIATVEKQTLLNKEMEDNINKLNKLKEKKLDVSKEVALSNISKAGAEARRGSTTIDRARVSQAYINERKVNSEIRKTEEELEQNTIIYKIELKTGESFLISHIDKNTINKLIDSLNRYLEENSEITEVQL